MRTEIFKDGNVILFHESFFDAEKNKQNKDVNDIRTQLLNFANENPNSIYVTFSGSNDTREFEGNSASVPVSILYKNLSDFLLFFQESGNYDLNKLLYGRNSEIEKEVAESFLLHKNSFSDSTSKIAIDEDIYYSNVRKKSIFLFSSRLKFSLNYLNSALNSFWIWFWWVFLLEKR